MGKQNRTRRHGHRVGGAMRGAVRHLPAGGGPTGPRMGGASPGSAQHLAARLAQARNKKSVKNLYGRALR